ncbi:MAG: caspase family protein [Candidatus Acidiferrales bacterium]
MKNWLRVVLVFATACLLASPQAAAQTELISYQNYSAFPALRGKVLALAYSSDGSQLAVAGVGSSVTLYDLPGQRVLATLNAAGGQISDLAFRPDGAYLAAATDARTVMVWDLKTLQPRNFSGHGGKVLSVAFSPSDDLLASAGSDKVIILWSLNVGREVGRLQGGHTKDITFVSFIGRGETLVSVGKDRQIVAWDVKSKSVLRQLMEKDPFIPSATTSPGSEFLILGTENIIGDVGFHGAVGTTRLGAGYQDRLKVYNIKTGLAEKVIENLIFEPVSVSLSADYKYIAVAQRDSKRKRSHVGLYDLERAVEVSRVPVITNITTVAFSPDGKWLSYGDEAGGVNVLKVDGVYPKAGYTGDLRGVKFKVTSAREPLVRPTGRLNLAILDLDSLGVEADVSRAISDQLNNRLAGNPAVRLVERRRIQALLKEQEFQHSGRTSPDQAVQLARILNVQKLVMGSVSKLGTTMTINASLVNVETAEIEGIREIQCNACGLEDLPEAVAELAGTLVGAPDATGGGGQQSRGLGQLPGIEVSFPPDGYEAPTDSLTIKGKAQHAQGVQGLELVVNGEAMPATRGATLRGGTKLTTISEGQSSVAFEQTVKLTPGNNIIVVRAVGADGSDDQRYIFVRRPAGTAATRSRPPAKKWALIVGISKYKDANIPSLNYAHRDAQALAEFIQTPTGGGYQKDNILLLTDEQATNASLTRALRSFLQKPDVDDLVLLYFASHGLPDPNRPENVYFLAHDTDASDIAGTALPMRDLEFALKHTLLAQRVVILTDACHSGAVGMTGSRRATVDAADQINRAFQQAIVNSLPGIAIFSSALARETSQEGPQWGGGHGVFTWFLLEGMQGKADSNGDGTVTLDELFGFVRENVKKETGDAQHPQVLSGNYDPTLPVAILHPQNQ